MNGTPACVMQRQTSSLSSSSRTIKFVALLCWVLPRLPVGGATGWSASACAKMASYKSRRSCTSVWYCSLLSSGVLPSAQLRLSKWLACEQLDHVACPSLFLLFEQVGQLAQMVLVAQRMQALQGFVGQPAGNRLDPPCNFLLCLLQMLDFLKTRFRRGQQRGGGSKRLRLQSLAKGLALVLDNWQIAHTIFTGDEISLSEIAQIGTGSTPSRTKLAYFDGNVNWVLTGEVNENDIIETKEKLTELAIKGCPTYCCSRCGLP